MIPRLALDTSATINYLRDDQQFPPQLDEAVKILVPLTVIGELLFGAGRSNRPQVNLATIHELISSSWIPLLPDIGTTIIYGQIRMAQYGGLLTASKVNDLWIAALCIQHDLPLLTNDAGYDNVAGLKVLHW